MTDTVDAEAPLDLALDDPREDLIDYSDERREEIETFVRAVADLPD